MNYNLVAKQQSKKQKNIILIQDNRKKENKTLAIFGKQNQTSEQKIKPYQQQRNIKFTQQFYHDKFKQKQFQKQIEIVDLQNQILFKYLKSLSQELLILSDRTIYLQEITQKIIGTFNQKGSVKKKLRRTSNQITRNFQCPYQKCNKNYGSDVSLNLHIKIKHNGGNKTQRQKLAVITNNQKQIILAKQKGVYIEQIDLNLPPNYLQQYKKKIQKINY